MNVDDRDFDFLTRTISAGFTRRGLGRMLGAAGMASLVGRFAPQGNVEARTKGKKKCKGNKKKCGGKCIRKTQCCKDAECDEGAACVGKACTCLTGFKPCLGGCIPEETCCVCMGGQTCQGGACACPAGKELSGGVCATPPTCQPYIAPCVADAMCCAGVCPANFCPKSGESAKCYSDDQCTGSLRCVGFICVV
jgi:hypothetical protein